MNTDHNLLFGVLALQADLIDSGQFAEACAAWATRKDVPLADVLVERGWLAAGDRADVEKVLRRKLAKHKGDAHAGLAAATTDEVRQSLAALDDADVRHSLATLTRAPAAPVQLATTEYVPEARERYRLSRLHATGGIGQVWLARDDSLGRDVAFKELRPERAAHAAVWARFCKEAQITGQLEHPGIVPIYELGRRGDNQAPFYTMRFVRGRTLAEATAAYHGRRKEGTARPGELRDLLTALVGVGNAIAFAHARGVLHRDLKPQNIVLGDYGEVIVLDWGLARLTRQAEPEAAPLAVDASGSGDETVQGQVLGTPAYMSPEQAEGRLDQLGPTTDVYGLGAILYEVLTGRPPFTGRETAALLREVIHNDPPRPGSVTGEVPRPLEAVCLKAIAKKPGDRYATARDLAGDVQRWLADEPVSAYVEPWAVRAGRWARRHRAWVTSGLAAAVMAMVGLAVVLIVQARANRDLRAANDREAARFQLAMDAIKLFHGDVSDDLLLKEKQFDGLRNKLLKGAADFYGKLEAQLREQPDRRSQEALATAYEELAVVNARIGSKADAVAIREKAVAVRRALVGQAGDAESRIALARSLLDLGESRGDVGDEAGAVELTNEALALAERAVHEAPQSEPAQDLLALSLSDVAALRDRRGDLSGARDAYERALAIRERLAAARPESSAYQSELAECLRNLARCHGDRGEYPAALDLDQRVVAIQQKVAYAAPADVTQQVRLAKAYHSLAYTAGRMGRKEQALSAHQHARAIRQQLADAYPAALTLQSELAQSHHNIAVQLKDLDRSAEALTELNKAIAIRQCLADADPSVTDYRSQLARSYFVVGLIRRKTDQFPEALAAHEKARTLNQQLAEANPEVSRFQEDLGNSLGEMGWLLDRVGKPAEALAALHQARTIERRLVAKTPASSSYRAQLAETLGDLADLQEKAGRPAEVAAALREIISVLEGHPTLSPVGLYDLACARARLAGLADTPASGVTAEEGRTQADQAMSFLRRAIAAGYGSPAKFREDHDLDALRGREDFKQLMAEVEAKQKTGEAKR